MIMTMLHCDIMMAFNLTFKQKTKGNIVRELTDHVDIQPLSLFSLVTIPSTTMGSPGNTPSPSKLSPSTPTLNPAPPPTAPPDDFISNPEKPGEDIEGTEGDDLAKKEKQGNTDLEENESIEDDQVGIGMKIYIF